LGSFDMSPVAKTLRDKRGMSPRVRPPWISLSLRIRAPRSSRFVGSPLKRSTLASCRARRHARKCRVIRRPGITNVACDNAAWWIKWLPVLARPFCVQTRKRASAVIEHASNVSSERVRRNHRSLHESSVILDREYRHLHDARTLH